MKEMIAYYTDGACSFNGGRNSKGGWAFVEAKVIDGRLMTRTYKGGKYNTTNNEMELTACFKAILKAYKDGNKQITVYSDSAYVVNAISYGWLYNWEKNGWKTLEDTPVKNKTIWEKLYRLLYEKGMHVKMVKVKGHDSDLLNQMADRAAVEAKNEV